jgi:GTPase
MPKKEVSITTQYPKTLIIGIHAPYNRTKYIQSYYEEFENLVKTLGIPIDSKLFIKLRAVDTPNFFTKGKLQELIELCQKDSIEQIILSEPLSPMQLRNLEELLDATIIDRTQLILDIFNRSAITNEGKTQVAIAQLQHAKSHLAGKGLFLDQQKGTIGVRGGAGETLKEREKRYIEDQIKKHKKHLAKMQTTRDIQRKRRLDTGVPHICLIGYTNAGKSTILNALTRADVLAEDKLFATLDTTTRELYINGNKKGIISDTVGFIQALPHQLIEAFKSTLSELQYASLLLHVVDLSDPNWQEHIQVVHEILQDLGVDKETLYVFNKADKVDNFEALQDDLDAYQPHVVISAQSKDGLKSLIEFLEQWNMKKV